MVTTWGREAGIEGFVTHSGRRTFATRLARQGASEKHLCMLLRHHTEDMPYEYVDPEYSSIKKALSSIHYWSASDYNLSENKEVK
ncbi:tyrosine-type recombinase/integrase [Endozoicomonas euniceicola]